MIDMEIIRHPGMALLYLANIVGVMGFYVPIIFSADRATRLGVHENQAALLLSIFGK